MKYEGIDITKNVEIKSAIYTERACGAFDDLYVKLNDPKRLWSKWGPKKDDTIEIGNSGVMYIDEIFMNDGIVELKAIPVKQSAKTEHTKVYEKITLAELAATVASEEGLKLKMYNVPPVTYERIEQIKATGLELIDFRASLESVAVKVCSGALVLYHEPTFEATSPVAEIDYSNYPGYSYLDTANGTVGKCIVKAGITTGSHTIGVGRTETRDIAVYSEVEAARFSKGLCRSYNKYEKTFCFYGKVADNIIPGTTIIASGYGLQDGKWFVDTRATDVITMLSEVKTRRTLEGY